MTLEWYGVVDATGSLHACFPSQSLARSVAARWGPGYRVEAVLLGVPAEGAPWE